MCSGSSDQTRRLLPAWHFFLSLCIFFLCLARCLSLQFISLSYANTGEKFKTFSSPPRALENISATHHHRTKPDTERKNVHIFFFFLLHISSGFETLRPSVALLFEISLIYTSTDTRLSCLWVLMDGRSPPLLSSARQIYSCVMSLRSVLSHFAVGEFHR